MMEFWLSIGIFLAAYAMIMLEKVHRTVIAMIGGVIVVWAGILSQEKAFASIDWNTIGLLTGMMIIVGITRQSGLFEYLAIKSAKLAKGEPIPIMVALAVFTAVASAFLDNVTTVLLVVPVTFAIADRLEVPAFPMVFAEIMASNIGGTATLIGDPPNIMIGSAAGLGFVDFLANVTLPAVTILAVTLGILVLMFRKQLLSYPEKTASIMAVNDEEYIKDRALMKRSLVVLALTMLGFVLHQALHLESATIALTGAALLMLWPTDSPEEVLLTVDWTTIFFFAGLFIMVGGMEHAGVIEAIAKKSLELTHGHLVATGLLVLWLSAVASAFVDNIPFTAAMIPLLETVGSISHIPMESVWWALSLGACLGGNGTLIGASANVIVAGISAKYGRPIGFIEFLKLGFPLMLLSIVLSSLYLYLFYWR
ncbi:MAG: ArsB/NhaD family transporter [Syntrophothermus sp.]|uniref:SLC13 family permease n=1 Tax=Syntrophothermus sp. TaxID=2736299 RepID=UPI00257A4D33|nr:ArsB/NhaD family transporter [Syntrophothermus sp.]NSW81691.1 ArsB/NhaD family transporter [Syntrophothermus sp.]